MLGIALLFILMFFQSCSALCSPGLGVGLFTGGLNRFYIYTTLDLCSAVVHTYTNYSVHVKDFYPINASKQQTYKSRFNSKIS